MKYLTSILIALATTAAVPAKAQLLAGKPVTAALPVETDFQGFGGAMPLNNNGPEYESKAEPLRSAPAQTYEFSQSNLADVLRYLATDAKINFISLDAQSTEAEKVVTFSITGSPFTVLETLCKAHGLALIPENGMWYIRPADDRELIGKAYQIRYNAMEKVEKVATASAFGSGGGAGSTPAIDLQGVQESFKVMPSELVKDIRRILDLPPEEETQQGGAGSAPLLGGGGPAPTAGPDAGGAGTPGNELSATHKPKVLWKSDSSTLYVVATRLQHLWVEGYLQAADKEQSQIAIEVKFLETSRDPSKEFGVDWNSILGQTGTFWQTTSKDWDKDLGTWIIERQQVPNTSGGYRGDLAQLFNIMDLNERSNNEFKYPNGAVYSAQDLSLKLRALLNDTETRTTSYPRMIVSNNREAIFKSVVNQPVLSASSSIGGGTGGAASTESITYLPIGTVLNILPRKMPDERINLNIGITVSSIIGEQIIGGNPYPVATSRVYNAPVEVNDGYTVAISGLDEAREKEGKTGVPLLSQIPIIKYAFSSKSRSKNHKNLLIFITPSVVDPRNGGLPENPQSVVPRKPDAMMPQKPKIDVSGQLAGGPSAVPGALEYLERECKVLENTVNESRQTPADSQKLTDMKKALNTMEQQIEQMATQYPDQDGKLSEALVKIAELQDRISRTKMQALKKSYF
ncbi:MAG: hypothetical protein JNJ83_13365 [Verrucomicrobiaceae bacterium]|nr:hypothetical protein [Verrucomicrobiaceae bacterium]